METKHKARDEKELSAKRVLNAEGRVISKERAVEKLLGNQRLAVAEMARIAAVKTVENLLGNQRLAVAEMVRITAVKTEENLLENQRLAAAGIATKPAVKEESDPFPSRVLNGAGRVRATGPTKDHFTSRVLDAGRKKANPDGGKRGPLENHPLAFPGKIARSAKSVSLLWSRASTVRNNHPNIAATIPSLPMATA